MSTSREELHDMINKIPDNKLDETKDAIEKVMEERKDAEKRELIVSTKTHGFWLNEEDDVYDRKYGHLF